ncbi:MAG TPA: RCC1 domain-containing protein [Gemmatimonadales bacterium]|nr:RCC1 domain-containing protein [Gemmatimonadales bacterium]
MLTFRTISAGFFHSCGLTTGGPSMTEPRAQLLEPSVTDEIALPELPPGPA